MKLTKCVNGHFYDEEKFESCPHCAGGSKLDVNQIFGGAPSAPKPAMTKVEPDDDMTVPLEWDPAEPAGAEPEFVSPVASTPIPEAVPTPEPEPASEPEPEFELLSKYSSEPERESGVEEITAGSYPAEPMDPALEEEPTEILDEPEQELVNGLLSPEEIEGRADTAAPEPEPKPTAEPEPTPSVTPEPTPFVTPEPAAESEPTSSAPAEPNISPAPAVFHMPEDEEHTVAFYDEVFTAVSQPAAETPAAPTEMMSETASVPVGQDETAPKVSFEQSMQMEPAAEETEEPKVFTAPPLPKVQNLPTPCVGWLIALNGVHAGQDFHLRVGKNYIGRDESMDVALTGDKSVSRNKHAIVIYEPKHHRYFIQPGESNELVYVNDEVVLLPMELKAYDTIVIGDIELWFMPLCDADHNWSEVIRRLQEQMQQ